jgi:hypothetical protein
MLLLGHALTCHHLPAAQLASTAAVLKASSGTAAATLAPVRTYKHA